MTYNITSTLQSSETDYDRKRKEEFANALKKMIDEHIIPNFGDKLNFTIGLGLFTSDEYGSYKIDFYNKKDELVCYIIADTIMGEWKLYKI